MGSVNKNQVLNRILIFSDKKVKSYYDISYISVDFLSSWKIDSSHRDFKAEAERARHGRSAIITMR